MMNNDYYQSPEYFRRMEEMFRDETYMKKLLCFTRNIWLSVLLALLVGYAAIFFYCISMPPIIILRVVFYIASAYCFVWFVKNLRAAGYLLSFIELLILFVAGLYMHNTSFNINYLGWWDILLAAMMLISENNFFVLWRKSKKTYKETKQFFREPH